MEKVKVIERPGVSILRELHRRFSTGKWKWIQRSANRGANGYCLVGGTARLSQDMGLGSRGRSEADQLLFEAIQERAPSAISIPSWNDRGGRKLPSVLEVIEEAIGDEVVK